MSNQPPPKTIPTVDAATEYEFIRILVDCGSLRWEYQVAGSPTEGRLTHDEDVSEWDNEAIYECTARELQIPLDHAKHLEVEYQ